MEYSCTCCASMIVGGVMGPLILTGGLPLVFANQPTFDGTNQISNCFDSSVGDPGILGSIPICYHAIILPTFLGALGIIFCLLFQMIYMIPRLYAWLWNWCSFIVVLTVSGIIIGVALSCLIIEVALS